MADPKNYVVRIKVGRTNVTLPGEGGRYNAGAEVEMTPRGFDQMSAGQLAAVDVIQEPAGAGLTAPQIDATFATDAAMDSAMATKQDAATAATDAELASGLAGKQDASTAATDAELAAAVAGLGGLAPYDNTKTYEAGNVVTSSFALWRALQTTVGNEPVASSPVTRAFQLAPDAGNVGASFNAFLFTPTINMTISDIKLFAATGVSGSGSVTVFLAPAFTAGQTPTPLLNTAGASCSKTTNQAFNSAGVVYGLTGEVALTAGTAYAVVVTGFTQISIATTQSLGNLTSQGDIYGASWGAAAFSSAYHGRYVLMQAVTVAWARMPVGPWGLNVDDSAIIPNDITDNWIVGSDRLERDATDTSKNKRAWFSKIKGAFRAGTAATDQWDDGNVGTNSIAVGNNVRAIGNSSVAFGDGATANGVGSHAVGNNTTASGTSTHAEGSGTTASGNAAHAEGASTTASGESAHSEGTSTVASGAQSHAEGTGSQATGAQSHAEGNLSQATGTASHAEGQRALATRYAQRAKSAGLFAAAGDAQAGEMVLRRESTNATAGVLTATNAAAALTGAGTNVLTLTASRAFILKISTVARRTDVQGEMAGFTWQGMVGRDSTGSARIIGTPVTNQWGDAAAAAYAVAVTIDTTDATNNYVAVTVTGEAAKTIRWVAKMEWVEVAG